MLWVLGQCRQNAAVSLSHGKHAVCISQSVEIHPRLQSADEIKETQGNNLYPCSFWRFFKDVIERGWQRWIYGKYYGEAARVFWMWNGSYPACRSFGLLQILFFDCTYRFLYYTERSCIWVTIAANMDTALAVQTKDFGLKPFGWRLPAKGWKMFCFWLGCLLSTDMPKFNKKVWGYIFELKSQKQQHYLKRDFTLSGVVIFIRESLIKAK